MFDPQPWHPARPGLYRPGALDPRGLTGPTRSQAQGALVRRTSHGLYVPSWVEQTTPQRIVEASMVMRGAHTITGWAALHWRGAHWFDGVDASGDPLPVEIVIGTHDIRPRPGLALSGEGLDPTLRGVVDGLAVADPRSAVSFLMRYAGSVRQAVRVLSMAAYDDLVSIQEIDTFLTPGQNSWTGVPQARAAVPLASESCWSPAEVDLVFVWVVLAGRPMPLCNAPIFDLSGRHLATPDVFDPVPVSPASTRGWSTSSGPSARATYGARGCCAHTGSSR
ncbi:hypothetical protein [Nocardioides rubriscoriae]|uniref:hypothetical protein n=1 Tax=Nocardioides rubriscoriae TaxID=642762 RepID=UPI0011E04BE5|nr:hypothetical protein [Nocardioides rubriscoriae]